MSNRITNQDKRDEYAVSIRKLTKKKIIESLRLKQILQPQYKNERILEEVSNQEIYNNIKLRTQLKQSLQYLTRQILSPNYNAPVQIWKFFDAGMIIPIMTLLNEQICLKQTFELISSILSKPTINVAYKFVNKGLMQHLVKYFSDTSFVEVISNIFLNLAVQSSDYVEIMLLNNIHQLMIKQFLRIIDSSHYQIDPIYYKKVLSFIVSALTNLTNTQIGNIEVQNQFNEIFNFTCNILQKGIMVKDCIVILYEVNKGDLVKNSKQIMTPLINTIAAQISEEAQELDNFLILLAQITPLQINYTPLFYLMFKPKKINKIYLKIIERLCDDKNGCNKLEAIRKDSFWWQKIFSKLDQTQWLIMLRIIEKTQVQFDCVYRFFLQCLASIFNTKLIVETFLILNHKLHKFESIQYKKKFVNKLQQHGILQKLINLALKDTFTLQQKASDLLYFINKIKEEHMQQSSSLEVE